MAKRKTKPKVSPEFNAKHAARVDALIAEYNEHLLGSSELIKDSHGWLVAAQGGIDEQRIFRNWLLQKLAGMQLVIEQMDSMMRDLDR